MKRLLKLKSHTHLSDYIDKISHIIIYNDINSAHSVFSSDDIDAEEISDDSFYLYFTDEQLLSLDKKIVQKITNLELLERIAKLNASLLSANQLNYLRDNLKQKCIIDKNDIQKILNLLKDCKSISYERNHRKTNAFLLDSGGQLKSDECLEIIHNLGVDDYVASSKSYNLKHIGNNIIIFEPDCRWEFDDGTIVEDLTIYVKLDIDETTKFAVALISMHEAGYLDDKPYKVDDSID